MTLLPATPLAGQNEPSDGSTILRFILKTIGLMLILTAAIQPGIAQAGAQSGVQSRAQGQTPDAAPSSRFRTAANRYCITCHSDRLKVAALSLESLNWEQVSQSAPVWEKVILKLRSESMPPPGAPRPDHEFYDSFAGWLESEIDAEAQAHPHPGRPAIQRLNRTEYANAVRDVLALEIDGDKLLPNDDSSYGFDNIGDVLTVSPTLMERYMSAAAKISRLAVGDASIGPDSEVYQLPSRLIQSERLSEDLPFGSRGGVAIEHHFPVDGEYTIRVHLQRDRVLDIVGLEEAHQLDLRLDGVRLRQFTVGGEGESGAAYGEVSPEESYQRTADDGLEVRFHAEAGRRVVGVSFMNRNTRLEGTIRREVVAAQYSRSGDIPGIGRVTITGPFHPRAGGETPSRRKIFECRPSVADEEPACARRIISTLAREAYRRPVTQQEVETLFRFYETGREKKDFESGIAMALRRLLVAPQFLFRMEADPEAGAPGAAYPVRDLDLASRLSFFLWSTIPDRELVDVATGGRLSDPEVLERQVRRMLADPRSDALVENFVGQWLFLRNMAKVVPDPETFPNFDENLRRAFQKETQLFFETMFHEDRSVLDLLTADFTFLNERLARHYGIPNVYGSHFRRVKLEDESRRGLVGQGSILTITSYPSRTSPTFRGKWLLENLLGSPPPPPPDSVPSLDARNDDDRVLTVREKMEAHRENPACFGCHSRMDPLGFALENFDAIGRWRTSMGAGDATTGATIDASGVLPDGTRFEGPAELRKILLDREDEIITTITNKLMTYALGRGVEYYDAPAIREILRNAETSDYRWSSLILGIVNSTPFRMRRSPQP